MLPANTVVLPFNFNLTKSTVKRSIIFVILVIFTIVQGSVYITRIHL